MVESTVPSPEATPGKSPSPLASMQMLIAYGLAGFVLWCVSLVLAFAWRSTILGGIDAWQGEKWWQLWVCALAMFGGLALMFVALLGARGEERRSPTWRRLIYGYNAVLTGLLLLAILMVVNVLVYNYATATFDWTESGIYTISDRSRNVLRGLEKPTKIYCLVSRADEISFQEVRRLLDNCRSINPKIDVEYVSPDLDRARVRELLDKYQFTERAGVLVVYGSEGNEQHQFLKGSDLFGEDTGQSGKGKARFVFKGEDALISALSVLEEDKAKPVVYFTQGNGELDLTDANPGREGQGMGVLRERLEKANYVVRGLQFSPIAGTKTEANLTTSNRVPEDANMVIIASPRTRFPDFALNALRAYMQPPPADTSKKGKLVALLDAALGADKKLIHTGLEPFLAEYSVVLGENRVLALPVTAVSGGDPLVIVAEVNPNSRNPISDSFRRFAFGFASVRTVKPREESPNPAGNAFTAESLMLAPSRYYPWEETDMRADPRQLAQDIIDNEAARKKLSRQNLSIAVTVTERMPMAGNDPHAFMRGGGDQKPRMVVFGFSEFISNTYMAENRAGRYFDLFTSTLSWLREKPANIGVEPKRRNTYELNVVDDALGRMRFLPAVIMLVGIVGLGTGVWLVRRK